MPRQLLFGLASAVGIAGLVARERVAPVRVAMVLSQLGAASYAIYLIHFPLLSIFARLAGIGGLRAQIPVHLAFIVVVVAAVAAGVAFHRIVERPLLGWASAKLELRPKASR